MGGIALLVKWLPELATALLVGAIGWLLHSGAMDHASLLAAQKLAAQASSINTACTNAQNKTTEISNALAKKLVIVNNKLADAERLHPSRCVPTFDHIGPAGQHDAATGDAGYAARNGITSDALRAYAAECETIGSQLDSCQDYAATVWKQCHH